VRVPFWPGGAVGGPFWHGGKGACVCLFDRVVQLGGPFWHGGKGVCMCLFGRVVHLVGLFGTEARARVYAFLAGGHRAPDDAPDDDFVF